MSRISTDLTPPQFYACPDIPPEYIVVIYVYSCIWHIMWFMLCFVDIDGIFDHHFVNILYVMLLFYINEQSDTGIVWIKIQWHFNIIDNEQDSDNTNSHEMGTKYSGCFGSSSFLLWNTRQLAHIVKRCWTRLCANNK